MEQTNLMMVNSLHKEKKHGDDEYGSSSMIKLVESSSASPSCKSRSDKPFICQVSYAMTEDMIQELLLRLPLKSLSKCKSLSKMWRQYISHNHFFHKRYLSKITEENRYQMLGLFVHKLTFGRQKPPQFFPTSPEGRSKKRKGDDVVEAESLSFPLSFPLPLDDPLHFLGYETMYVKGSSNGFLLCSLEIWNPMQYFICNPINKQSVALPRPNADTYYVTHGFIFQSTYSRLDKEHYYKVVRIIPCGFRVPLTILTIGILTSKSPKWEEVKVVSPFSFIFSDVVSPIIIKEEVIYQRAGRKKHVADILIICNPRIKDMQLMEVPPTKQSTLYDVMGIFSGVIHYARHELGQLEIWILNENDDSTRDWFLKHKISLDMTPQKFPKFIQNPNPRRKLFLEFIAFHPMTPRFIFLLISDNKRVLYDVYTSKLELVCELGDRRFNYDIFPYTYDLIGHDIFVD